jgi:hypothetical protein
MPPPQPLGRSLVPLADESLPGFLLRLSFRLNLAPSVYVWVSVTFGEPGFVPRPIEAAQPPDVRECCRRSWNFTWWTLLTRDNPGSGYRRLRAELDALAATLATTIDPSHPADSTLGAARLYVSRCPRRPRNHEP